jgi:DNA polymerase III alpha subunit
MRLTKLKETILTEEDVVAAIYSGKDLHFEDLVFDNVDVVKQFNNAVAENADHIAQVKEYFEDPAIEQSVFDHANQSNWAMPDSYKDFKMVEFLLDKTQNEEEYQRVVTELELFIQHGMFDLLVYLKYLVDTLRANNVLWGVGRGSSVASYCLYLIGVHKIDSIKYKLNIKEFLK